jgi:hypothetical protein
MDLSQLQLCNSTEGQASASEFEVAAACLLEIVCVVLSLCGVLQCVEQVYQCMVPSPGVGYRKTPKFADKVLIQLGFEQTVDW